MLLDDKSYNVTFEYKVLPDKKKNTKYFAILECSILSWGTQKSLLPWQRLPIVSTESVRVCMCVCLDAILGIPR